MLMASGTTCWTGVNLDKKAEGIRVCRQLGGNGYGPFGPRGTRQKCLHLHHVLGLHALGARQPCATASKFAYPSSFHKFVEGDNIDDDYIKSMRFKGKIKAVGTFAKLCASLSSLHPIAWCRLTDEDVRFTVIPEKGSQCWSALSIDTIFEQYTIQSATAQNTINLELSLQALTRALKSAQNATEVSIRLTKRDQVPVLCLTIHSSTFVANNSVVTAGRGNDEFGDFDFDREFQDAGFAGPAAASASRERQTVITQDVPVKVLANDTVASLMEPRLREPDIHIYLPNLAQLKSISEKFTKLAMSTSVGSSARTSPRLELSANMHGCLKLAVKTDALSISSLFTGLVNPELDATQIEGGSDAVRNLPSTRMKELGGPDGENEAGWAKVRLDAKDWGRVLSVGRISSRVICCILDETAVVLYCFIGPDDDAESSCLTYFISSFSA